MMTGDDVGEIVAALTAADVDVWLDGGWGVDALVGEQTRPHADLDLVIALAEVDSALAALTALGFVRADDELPTRLVVRDGRDRRIDFHTVAFDRGGGGLQRLQGGTIFRYPPAGFAGRGRVGGRTVRCLTAEVQARCHTGYEPDETDRHDLRLLRDRCGLVLPVPQDERGRGRLEDERPGQRGRVPT